MEIISKENISPRSTWFCGARGTVCWESGAQIPRGQKEEPQVIRGHFPEGVTLELGSDGRVGAGWAKMQRVQEAERAAIQREQRAPPHVPPTTRPRLPHLGK